MTTQALRAAILSAILAGAVPSDVAQAYTAKAEQCRGRLQLKRLLLEIQRETG